MVVKIDYGELASSSTALNKAAKYCGDYASKLRRKVPNELDNLTRGSSSYTSSASYFASAKIQSLEKQQQKCLDVSGKIDTFIKDAKSTDQRVAGIMKKEGNEFRKANGLSFGWADGLMQAITRFAIDDASKNSISRWISAGLRDISDGFNALILDFKCWYACKGGKYVFSAIFKAVGVVVAALAAFAALVVLFPISVGGWALVVAICTAVSSCIALADATIALMSSIQAAQLTKTDPGWAARYSETNSISGFLKKTCFEEKWMNIASNYAAIGINAISAICMAVNIWNMGRNAKLFFRNEYRANANWKNEFKMWDSKGRFSFDKTIKNWKTNLKGLDHAFTHDYQYTQWIGARKRNYQFFNSLEKMKKSTYYKNTMKFFDKLKDGVKKFEKYAF